MHDLDIKIKEFGSRFYDRLDNKLLQDAINYVDRNERGLAFETICDHLSEYDVSISEDEYIIVINICYDLLFDTNDVSILHLKGLIRRN